MPKLKIGDLARIKSETKKARELVGGGDRAARVTVHMGTCGIAAGADKVHRALTEEIEAKGIRHVLVTTTGCAGLCSREPMVTVELAGNPPVKYADLDPKKIRQILNQHVLGGSIVSEFVLGIGCERTL